MSDETNGIPEGRSERIPVKKIRENPEALRGTNRKTDGFLRLKDSIAKNGVLQSLLVREIHDPATGDLYYGLIDGLQRFTCASELGLETVPANIVNKKEAEVIEAQFIANAQRIPTKNPEFARACLKILEHSPTLTKAELASRLSITPQWLDQILKLNDLHPDLQELVTSGDIPLSNGIALAKLPEDEQLRNADLAQTMPAGEFQQRVATRVKEIRDANRKGRDPNQEFVPFAHPRKPAELKAEFENMKVGPELIKRMGCKNAQDGWKAALMWVNQMDPVSIDYNKQKEEDRKLKAKEANDKKKREREEQKAKAAAAKQAELMNA